MNRIYHTIGYELANVYALLTLNRPQALNAIDPTMLQEIAAAVTDADANDSIRALIITGAGERAFCSGMDLRAFTNRTTGVSSLQARDSRCGFRHPLATFRKPVIGAINGLAYGGGLELTLLCDIVVAADRATFAAAEVARGLIPGNGATQRLPRKVGLTFALEMLMTGQPIDAPKALRIGLVNRVVPANELLSSATGIATAIASNGPIAVRMVKEAATRGVDLPLEKGLQLESDLLTLVQSSEDAEEGVRAFIEKRSPNWSGR
jgi:enoyl-CoA hydratase/carnithine racemase